MVMSLRRIVAVVAFAKLVPVMVAAARDRLNAITASTNHAEFAVKTLEGRCARADALRSAFTGGPSLHEVLGGIDHRMAAMGFVGFDSIEAAGGEECVIPVRLEQGALSATGLFVELGDLPHHQPRGDVFALRA